MSTIAWDGSTLAADTQATCDGCAEIGRKLHRCGNLAFAAVGDAAEAELIVRWIRSGFQDDAWPSFDEGGINGIVVQLDSGAAFTVQGKRPVLVPIRERCQAFGSGRNLALAAMMLGKTAPQAVKLAAKRDVYTNDTIETARVRKKRGKFQ